MPAKMRLSTSSRAPVRNSLSSASDVGSSGHICLVNFMGRYRLIGKLHSDMGKKFKAHVIEHLYDLWGVVKMLKRPYTPWSNGLVEDANRTIQPLLKVYCENIHVWDQYILCVMQSYNSIVQVSK